MVGSAELRKREHENKAGGNVPFTFASSPLSESLEQTRGPLICLNCTLTQTFFKNRPRFSMFCQLVRNFHCHPID